MSSAPSFLDADAKQPNKRDVPLLAPLLIAVFVLGLFGFAYMQYKSGDKAAASGSITKVTAVELADKAHVLVMVEMRITNLDEKPLVVFGAQTKLKASGQEYSDTPSAAVEIPRYYQAYPALKSDAAPLTVDAKILPKEQRDGVIAVSYPVAKDIFDKRESLTVTVNFREQRPLVLKQ